MSDRITGTTLSLAWKDYDPAVLVLYDSDSDFSGRLAYSSLPKHAIRLLTQQYFGRLHPLSDKIAKKSHSPRSPLLPWSVPDSSKIKIIEFFLDDLQLLLFWSFLSLGWGLGGLFNLDFLLGLFWDLFGLFFKLWSDWLYLSGSF
jgi:hypothetical protein